MPTPNNELGFYNPEYFANEGLTVLFETLGMANRVYRGLDMQRESDGRGRGDTINIPRPTKFTAQTFQAGTGTTAQDIQAENVTINLTQHQEVKFGVTDREIAYAGERLIGDHIRSATHALALKIDSDLHALGDNVGPKAIVSGTGTGSRVNYITGPRKVLRQNSAPANDLHYIIDTGLEEAFLGDDIFISADKMGDSTNSGLMNGSLGRRFGVEVYCSNNSDTSKNGISSTGTASGGDVALAINNAAGYPANVSTVVLDSGNGTETFQEGDTFTIANDPTTYILTGDTPLVSGGGTFNFFPALRRPAADNAVVTFNRLNAVEQATHFRNLMFHRNAFAIGFAPLPSTGETRGNSAQIATVSDEDTGLSLRARMWYDGAAATNYVAFDVLYGVQVLDPMLAVRVLRSNTTYPA